MQNKFAVLVLSLFFVHCGSDSATSSKTLSAKTEETSKVDNKQESTDANISYNLAAPVATWTLPNELLEISGNAWVDDEHLLAIEDLHPLLYVLKLDKNVTVEKTIPFAKEKDKKFDIEDVALQGNTAYALWSHGTIYKIDDWQKNPSVTKLETDLDKANNTEGLCFDPVSQKLLVACKNKSGDDDEKKSTKAVYQFDLSSGKLVPEPYMLIEKKDFKEVADEAFKFYPSAIAVHPQTHDIYVLSTKDTKGLARYSHEGKLIGFETIDKDLMPQPEGLCFSPTGTLFISTEGKDGQPAKILKFEAGGKK